jgi:signal transduction histidine kinase
MDSSTEARDATPTSGSVVDFFGALKEIAAHRARLEDTRISAGERSETLVTLAWYLRQRDTHDALRYADAATALVDSLQPSERHVVVGRLFLTRAEAAWLFNRLDEANAELARARAEFEAVGDAVGLGDAHMLHASLLDQTGGDRLSAVREAGLQYRASGNRLRERISATWSACVEATANPDVAESAWGEALREASELQQAGLTTFVEGAKGTLAWRRSDPGAAIVCFQRGFEAGLESGQLQSAITLAQNIGIAFSTLNDHEGAIAWANRARELVQPTGWPYATGWCLMQTGSILLGLRRVHAAKELLLEGMPSMQGSEGSRNHTMACELLGEACLELNEDKEALRWCVTAHQGAVRLGFPDLICSSLRNKALALSRLGLVDEAVRAAEQGLAIARDHHDWQRVATIGHVRAQIARQHGMPPPPGSAAASGAIHHLEVALTDGAHMPGYEAPAEWHAELSGDHEAAGNLERALAYERRASVARARSQSRRADDMATAMLVRHQTERALADARQQRLLAQASELRAALLETQTTLEKERMQSLLVHAGKMVAIGRLASGVVHEMSHPVGTLLLLAESLEELLTEGSAAYGDTLRMLVGEARRLQQFISRLRDFARAEPPQLALHDLRCVLADARQLFAPRLTLQRIRYSEELPSLTLRIDPQRFALAVANLVFNAADALGGRADPQIYIDARSIGEVVELRVDDNGPGLPEAVIPRLFEPFFTTKPEGQGLGLGLAISAESLAAMGGRITATNRPQGGARFTISLPLVS